jgi:hypothetical protein
MVPTAIVVEWGCARERKENNKSNLFPLIRACTALGLEVVYRTSNYAYRHMYR